LAALLALGLRGIEKNLAIKVPPLDGTASADVAGERLPKTLAVATERFMAKSSLAREVLGDDFVDHFGGTRQHELRQFEEAVTDWELERYLELA
jgi:glutamine synthetase